MSGRDITAVIGQNTYYEAVGRKRSFKNASDEDVEVWMVKIVKADDKDREGKFALVRSTKHAGDQASGDKYVTDITYGAQCDLLNQLNTPEKVTLNTRTFDGTAPVNNPYKPGTKKPTETNANKEWDLKANEDEWKQLGAGLPSAVTDACSAKTPAATATPPAVSNTNLGSIDATKDDATVNIEFDKNIAPVDTTNGNISIKVNGDDKTLSKDGYTITDKTLSINKTGIDALGITNATTDNKLIVNADQIADKADPTKKNVATGELALRAEAPAAAATPPAVSNTNLGSIDATKDDASVVIAFDKNIAAVDDSAGIIVNNGSSDVPLTNTQYEIGGNMLKIKKEGLTALGITDNSTADRTLSLKEGQIADATDATQKNAATALTFKTEATVATDTPPVVSNTDLGELDIFDAAGNVKSGAKIDITFDKEISLSADLKVQATGGRGHEDVTLTGADYDINGNVLTITEEGIKDLQLAPGGNIVLRGGQIENKADARQGIPEDITITYTEKTDVSTPPPSDTQPEPVIKTPADKEFVNVDPIELEFQNPAKLVDGQVLNSGTVIIEEIDDAGSLVAGGVVPEGLTYEITSDGKLKITPTADKPFDASKRFRIAIVTGILQKDDGSPYEGRLGHTFKTKSKVL